MTKAMLVESTPDGERTYPTELLPSASQLAPALSPVALRILGALHQRPDYAGGVSRSLGLHEQKVYYHIQRLQRAGLVRVVREERRRGAPCRYLAPVAPVLAVKVSPRVAGTPNPRRGPPEVLQEFLADMVVSGELRAPIVVGSPLPHGPFMAAARDGHHASALAFHLGSLAAAAIDEVVLLDTDVRTRGLERGPLILVGGPVANILSMEVNPRLPVRFDWREGWRIIASERSYASEAVGLVAKVPSPWQDGSWVLLLSGLHHQGTLAAVMGLTNYSSRILAGYTPGDPFLRVVEGQDRNGDGRIDAVAVLE